jgi:hypothetical protein
MPSVDYLIERGARFKTGEPVTRPEEPKQEHEAPLVVAAKIDASPITEAAEKLSDAVSSAMDSQRQMLEVITESMRRQQPSPATGQEVWEFKIKRDSKGRIESIVANRATDQSL